MNVTGDRTVEHGLATVGYDDEGVQTQRWDIVRDGVLVGYQLDRSMGHLKPELNDGRSNGCAYADSPGHIPIQRMANVSLQPGADGPQHRRADRPRRARHLRRRRQVVVDRHAALQLPVHRPAVLQDQRRQARRPGSATSPTRRPPPTSGAPWRPSAARETWVLGGAFNCGKAQPGQVAAVSHGCPTSLFRGVRILNTTDEAGH